MARLPARLGYGDVRLSGVLGIALGYLGWGPLLVGVYAGFLLGGVGGGLLSVLRVVDRKAYPVRAVHAGRRAGRGLWPGPALWRLSRRRADAWTPAHPGRERLTPMLRWLTAGESHGPSLVAILEGLPAHVAVTTADIADALARRRLGYGRGARMKFEQDEVDDHRRRPARRDPGRPGRDPDRQHRVAQVGEGDVGRPGRPGRAGGAGPQRRR